MFFGGGGGGGGGGFGGAAGGGPRKSKPIMHKLAASLEDLYLGKKKKLAINREVACSGCDGKGGSKVETCSSCKGRGMKVITKQIGPGMIQQMQCPCDQCEATGEIISEAHKCKECKGKKTARDKKIIEVLLFSISSLFFQNNCKNNFGPPLSLQLRLLLHMNLHTS